MIELLSEKDQISFIVRNKLHNLCRQPLNKNGQNPGYLKIKKIVFSLCDKEPIGQIGISRDQANDEYLGEWTL